MGWRFRRTKRFGPFSITLTHRGVSTSVGAGGLRYQLSGPGKHRRTTSRIPAATATTRGPSSISNSFGPLAVLGTIFVAGLFFLFGSISGKPESPSERLVPESTHVQSESIEAVPFVLPAQSKAAPNAPQENSGWRNAPIVESTPHQEVADSNAAEVAPVRVASAVKPDRPKPPAALREWADKSGKYKTQARLADLAGATVYLQRSDGQIKAVQLDRLSVADQAYVTAKFPIEQLYGAVVGIADGDTITVLDANKMQHKIRLDGIDAPESNQDHGTQARKVLGKKLIREIVRIDWHEKDRYGRILGDVFLVDRWINREQIAEGWAWHYAKYNNSAVLAEAEREAKSAMLGLWEHSSPIPPWEFRRPATQPRAPPQGSLSLIAGGLDYNTLQSGGTTVYITDSGTRYHRAGCKYLKDGGTPISLDETQGIYTPCKICHPELIKRRPEPEEKAAAKKPRKSYNQSRPSSPSPTYFGGGGGGSGTVQVRGYYRKDGTYVRPHTRRAPSR